MTYLFKGTRNIIPTFSAPSQWTKRRESTSDASSFPKWASEADVSKPPSYDFIWGQALHVKFIDLDVNVFNHKTFI